VRIGLYKAFAHLITSFRRVHTGSKVKPYTVILRFAEFSISEVKEN